uniref:DUF4373 domain-containing protein n=1 Tax=Strongyloides papillosus TaxID=174720 RepID=A0A0N5B4P6_STREA
MVKNRTTLHKVLGKIELTRKDSNLLDTFYICQWGNRSGHITIQSFESLSDYIREVAKYEGNSTSNRFVDKKTVAPVDGRMSNEQISFLLSAIKQYENTSGTSDEGGSSYKGNAKSGHNSTERVPTHGMGVGDVSALDDDEKKSSGTASTQSTSSEDSKSSSPSLLDDSSSDRGIDKGVDDGSVPQDEMQQEEEMPSCMEISDVLKDDFGSEPYCKPHGEEEKVKENGEKGDGSTPSVESDDDSDMSQTVTDSEDSITDTEGFTEKYPNSPQSWSGDFAPVVDSCYSDEGYKKWRGKWMNIMKDDMDKCQDEPDWSNLEIISEMEVENTFQFVCYDTKTHLMSMVEYDQVPASQRYKIRELKKFAGPRNVARSGEKNE